jgi:hypothetical protein
VYFPIMRYAPGQLPNAESKADLNDVAATPDAGVLVPLFHPGGGPQSGGRWLCNTVEWWMGRWLCGIVEWWTVVV